MGQLLITDPVHRERVLRWVEALESGEFTQCNSRLRQDFPVPDGESGDTHPTYCCLGVACVRYHEETGSGEWEPEDDTPGFVVPAADGLEAEVSDQVLPAAVALWLFGDKWDTDPSIFGTPVFGDIAEVGAAEANDDLELTFEEIAAAVRVELLGEEDVELPPKLQSRIEPIPPEEGDQAT